MAARRRLSRPAPPPTTAGLSLDVRRRLDAAETQLDALDATTRGAWAFINGLDEEDSAAPASRPS